MLKCEQLLAVGILTFISMIKKHLRVWKLENLYFSAFYINEQLKFYVQLSWAWNKFYNFGAWSVSVSFASWTLATCKVRGDGGLVVSLRTPDQGVLGSNPARIVEIFWAENSSHVCPSSPRCLNGSPDRVMFVKVCYPLSAISRCMLLERGREIFSLRTRL